MVTSLQEFKAQYCMVVLHVISSNRTKDEISADLCEAGTTGIVEEDLPDGECLIKAFFPDTVPGLAERYRGDWHNVETIDWVEVSHAVWEPLLVGERFFLIPDWRNDPTPPGRMRLEIHPGQACGTGWHPATQLMLEAMERYVLPATTVLDVGTGSGILCAAAAMLGAERIAACDIDHDAVQAAGERFRALELQVGLFAGSVRSVRPESVDLILANINAPTISQLAGEFRRVLRQDGKAVVAGFKADETARVRQSLETAGLTVDEMRLKEEWAAFVLTR